MTEKLDEVEKRFDEVSTLVCSPEIVSDLEKYTKLMKELKHLTPVVEKYRQYKKACRAYEDGKAMLDEKMKIKLVIVEAFNEAAPPSPLTYYISDGSIEHWQYSPPDCKKRIFTDFV